MHLEIACDESGFSGGNLVGGGHSPVFAHASVRIESETASGAGPAIFGGKSAPAVTASTSRPKSCGHVDDQLCCGCSAPAAPSTATHMFTSPTPDSSSSPACSTCYSAGRPCAESYVQDGTARTRPMALALYRSGEQSYGTTRWQDFLTLGGQSLPDQQPVAAEDASSDVLRGGRQHGPDPQRRPTSPR